MRARLGYVIVLAGALVAGVARAQQPSPQQQQLYDTCYSPSASDADTVTSCTALIQTGQYSGTGLSHLYNNRGTGYQGQNQLDEAFADYGKAIQFDATNAQAYKNRGVVYALRGDNQDALGQFNMAISLKPNYSQAYTHRAMAKRALGDTAGAATDDAMAAKLSGQPAQ
jgi:tetratricopeptide (TPR) repeat protein